MKSFTIKNYVKIGLSLTTLGAIALGTGQSALAASFNVGGYQWDAANSVTTGRIIQGQQQTNAYNAVFEPAVKDQTIGRLLGTNTDPNSSYSLTLGQDDVTESIIELGWGDGMSLANENGNDLVIYESGSNGEPEAFAVSVKKVGASDFTDYRYQFSSGNWDSNFYAFATAIDLSSFGLNLGDEIESIRIKNLISSDRVTGQDGQGFLGGQYQAKVGPNGQDTYYAFSKLDPDITFVAGLHSPKPVPEPASTLGLLALGAFGISYLGKRKQH